MKVYFGSTMIKLIKKQVVYRAGDPTELIYMVLKGEFLLRRRLPAREESN